MRGVIIVALGAKARNEAAKCVASLEKHSDAYVKVVTSVEGQADLTTEQKAHWLKTRVFDISPYDYTLLLDADTRVRGDISFGFGLLEAGWDIAMVPSQPPRRGAVLWHLSAAEREYTLNKIGHWDHIMLNTGVMFFRKSPAAQELWSAWNEEWLRFKDRDQGAFLRALHRCPVYLWLLGTDYNSRRGSIIEHHFGACV